MTTTHSNTRAATSPGFRPRPGFWLTASGALLVFAMALVALLAPRLAPYDPARQFREGFTEFNTPAPPGPRFTLGADNRGRDVLSRLVHGARISLTIGIGAAAIALGLALLVGLPSGFFGGWTDTLLMRLTDAVMAFPTILLAVALAAVLERNLGSLLLVVGLVNWTAAARVIRAESLALRQRLYVEAAWALGASAPRVLLRHVLPHLLPTLLVLGSLSIGTTILLDAGLNFLGIGLPPPAPTWGEMLQEGQASYASAPWLAFWPGLAVVVTVGGFNMLAFGLRSLFGVNAARS